MINNLRVRKSIEKTNEKSKSNGICGLDQFKSVMTMTMPNEQKKILVPRTRRKREVYHDKRQKKKKENEKKHNHKRKDICREEASVKKVSYPPHRPLQIVNGSHNNTLAKRTMYKIK